MQLEAIESAHRGLAVSGTVPKEFVLRDAQVIADGHGCRIHERDACGFTKARVEIAPEWDHGLTLQLDEAVLTDQVWECSGQVLQDILRVEGLGVTIARTMEPDQNGHHFR